MHSFILDDKRLACLQKLVDLPETKPFYLAGGTALSLQLGLRVSVDFDFFSPQKFNTDALYAAIHEAFPDVRRIHIDADTCDLMIDAIQVSFFYYPYPLVAKPVSEPGAWANLQLASIQDIAAMKLAAIGSRGSRKDFYDLYEIDERCPSLNSKRLLAAVQAKFGPETDLTYMLMGLSFFDDAETEVLPHLFVPADWEEIKRYMIAKQRELFAIYEARFRTPID